MIFSKALRAACLALVAASLIPLASADPILPGARSENVEAVGNNATRRV